MNRQPGLVGSDDFFRALGNVERRRILVALLTQESIQVPELTARDDSSSEQARIVELYHHHLPKLVNIGVIEWDIQNWEVRRGSSFDQIRPTLDLLATNDSVLPGDWL
ncbi:DUF7344 domain-containing protein [Haloarcula amylolytica]|uniref:DUF7344 domain-containing protein n=1 Tax=Haloarcula amylolytica TaxID=396317 RepID=UPI003C734647